jgi:hypothetical protein
LLSDHIEFARHPMQAEADLFFLQTLLQKILQLSQSLIQLELMASNSRTCSMISC